MTPLPPHKPENPALDAFDSTRCSASEFRQQSAVDALLWASAEGLTPRPGLTGRVRRAAWRRRLRIGIELAAAATLLIGFAFWFFDAMRQPFQLEGFARVVDARGEPTKLASGAWIESADTSATLRIRGHARIELSPHTRIRVQGERSPYSVTLDSGQLMCHVQPKSAAVEFVTPDGRVAGQGSDEATFSLNYSKDENPMNRKLVVSVLAGVAMLATLDGQTTLAAGESQEVGRPAGQPSGTITVGMSASAVLDAAKAAGARAVDMDMAPSPGTTLQCFQLSDGRAVCLVFDIRHVSARPGGVDSTVPVLSEITVCDRPDKPKATQEWRKVNTLDLLRGSASTRPETQPVDAPVVITNADNGKTVTVRVGQAIRVELKGDRQGAGWEYDRADLAAVDWLKPDAETMKRLGGGGLNEFVPDPKFADVDRNAIGTYVFLFKAAKVGEDKLGFRLMVPGGPFPVRRNASGAIAKFSVTVKVVEAAAPGGAVIWGEAVDGMQLGIEPPVAGADGPVVTLTLRNTGNKPRFVCHDPSPLDSVRFHICSRDGVEVPYRGKLADRISRPECGTVLAAGKQLQFKVGLTGYAVNGKTDYTIAADYHMSAKLAAEWLPAGSDAVSWGGKLTSGKAAFNLAETKVASTMTVLDVVLPRLELDEKARDGVNAAVKTWAEARSADVEKRRAEIAELTRTIAANPGSDDAVAAKAKQATLARAAAEANAPVARYATVVAALKDVLTGEQLAKVDELAKAEVSDSVARQIRESVAAMQTPNSRRGHITLGKEQQASVERIVGDAVALAAKVATGDADACAVIVRDTINRILQEVLTADQRAAVQVRPLGR